MHTNENSRTKANVRQPYTPLTTRNNGVTISIFVVYPIRIAGNFGGGLIFTVDRKAPKFNPQKIVHYGIAKYFE